MSFLFTSESVSEGHPDKVCDAISDGVLDAIIGKDPNKMIIKINDDWIGEVFINDFFFTSLG